MNGSDNVPNYGYQSDTSGFGGSGDLTIPTGNYNPAALNTAISTPNYTPGNASGMGGLGAMFGNGPGQIGANLDTLKLGLGGLQTIGSLWGAFQAANVANQQLKLAKGTTNANLANQTQAYNTSLSDRATSRGVAEGMTPGAVQDYISKNSLQQRTV